MTEVSAASGSSAGVAHNSSAVNSVVVIGLGNAGLPVACALAAAGYRVVGVDVDAEKVRRVGKGQDPNSDPDPELPDLLRRATADGRLTAVVGTSEVSAPDVLIFIVQTPITVSHLPDNAPLEGALKSAARLVRPGCLVIVESTLAPGTMESVVRPQLERLTGLRVGADFALVHVPERLMPGRSIRNIRTLSRVIGAWSPEDGARAVAFYRPVINADLDVVDCATAEVVKTAENAYRDVQIAFANELALLCEMVGANVWRVRDLVNKVPERNVHYPGPGVGGHCIPKDPWLLAAAAPGTARLIAAAREVNDSMPAFVVSRVIELLADADVPLAAARVALLGLSYLADSPDSRNAPSEVVARGLRERGVGDLRMHDPLIDGMNRSLDDVLMAADVAVLLVKHRAYRDEDWAARVSKMRRRILFDTRNLIPGDISGASVVRLGVQAPKGARRASATA